jgi:hypothetical protein
MSQEKNKPIIKKYYEVRIECMLPATLTYRILAETPEQAAEFYKHQQPIAVKHKLAGRKESKISVSEAYSSIIIFIRNIFK